MPGKLRYDLIVNGIKYIEPLPSQGHEHVCVGVEGECAFRWAQHLCGLDALPALFPGGQLLDEADRPTLTQALLQYRKQDRIQAVLQRMNVTGPAIPARWGFAPLHVQFPESPHKTTSLSFKERFERIYAFLTKQQPLLQPDGLSFQHLCSPNLLLDHNSLHNLCS